MRKKEEDIRKVYTSTLNETQITGMSDAEKSAAKKTDDEVSSKVINKTDQKQSNWMNPDLLAKDRQIKSFMKKSSSIIRYTSTPVVTLILQAPQDFNQNKNNET